MERGKPQQDEAGSGAPEVRAVPGYYAVVSRLLRWIILIVGRTIRWEITDSAGLLADRSRQPVIFAFWHNRIFLMPYLFRTYWRARQRHRVAVLVSASRDGERLAQVLSRFDLICVRGSSSRRGRQALRELTRLIADGYDTGITPDGPRGPCYRVQDGVISLAQLTQAPIVPVSYNLRNKITVNSWDRFLVPLPFTTAQLRIGLPLRVPADADGELRERRRQELENVLQELSDKS